MSNITLSKVVEDTTLGCQEEQLILVGLGCRISVDSEENKLKGNPTF
jgi:hypothetical protein